MNKRRASRELALIAFSQLSKNIKNSEDINIGEIIHKAAGILAGEAESTIELAMKELIKIRDYISNYEIEHPVNLERSLEEGTVPVNIPLTSDMLGRVEMVMDAAEKTYSAIELVKLASFEELNEVKDYSIKLVTTFVKNQEDIDLKIKKQSKGWDVERLVKIDRDILRIAIAEILYIEDVPKGVSIDEAVELAKKYSTEESSGFINGILGQVANV